MRVNPAAVYRQIAVETSSPGQLIVMLYRGAIGFIRQAVLALEREDLETAHNKLLRAQAIVFELQEALKRDVGPVAESLDALYDYFFRQLTEANLKKDPRPAAEVADMMQSLLEAWEVALGGAPASPIVVRSGAEAP